MDYGEFHYLQDNSYLIFITEKSIYYVSESKLNRLDGYKPAADTFTGATVIGSKYLAVSTQSLGINFYEIVDGRYVKPAGGYAAAAFNKNSI